MLGHPRCHVHALATLLDIYELEAKTKPAAVTAASDLCDRLATKDEVRAAYWNWRKRQLGELTVS